ncbi:MAG: VWA domain-containing protein, partial [Methanosarcinaceae archaeon]|nr:VWA domain-containing protein [Methanosarcinaceae archaeon]
MYKNNKNKLKIWSKLFAVLIAMSMILSVVPLGAVMAEVPPTLTVNASVNLENIALGDTTTMTVDITSDAISETRVRHPLDLMLIMDSSGSMRRYSNTINST